MGLHANIINNIRQTTPYVPGEQPKNKVVKLNTNENPYPPSPAVIEAMREIEGEALRKYPDPCSDILVSALAKEYGVGKDQVFVGVGSDDVLSMCFLTFFNSDKPLLFPDITYSFYKVWAELYRIPYECPSLDEKLRLRREDYYKGNGGVIFPNPNATTAIYENLEFVEDILRHNQDVTVIVDEAYIDFAGESALRLLEHYENLIVVQTFSKSRSMAGMRIGYAISSPAMIQYLQNAKYSFNSYTMSLPSLISGTRAIEDSIYFEETKKKILTTREWAKEELTKLGFCFPDSNANFILAAHPEHSGAKLFEALKQNNIYVRHWNDERINRYLRITIGTRDEMKALFNFLEVYNKN